MVTITPSEPFRKFVLSVPLTLDSEFLEAMASKGKNASTMVHSKSPIKLSYTCCILLPTDQ